ncbi:MAG: SDR family NAD(P)-dependent oxidoreductase [Endomicrobium sp.]|jgi:nucleoside-diphosphate-sugar epimerase|nr:SDR family NAD(P)-dependent oxidoreductase [Endomicrobium sp.]
MLKVLVTGASGFVGSHIVETLLKTNYRVICAVRKTSNLRWIKNLALECIYGDLNDKGFLEANVKGIDVIVHCAGIVRAMAREEYFKANVENTKNLCEAILKNNPCLKKFIFISSQAAMGPADSSDIEKAADKCNPVSDYGLSKLAAELEIKKMLLRKVSYTILRPASVYGPRDKDIFIFFNLVRHHLRPFTITKRFLQLVYVKDVAKAVTLCIGNKKTDNNIYYLANSSIYTWADISKIISSSVGVKTFTLPIPDFFLKFVGLVSEMISCITKKPTVLNNQKITEMLQECWAADTKPAENALNIEFTNLEIASKITYNWYLINDFF